MYEWFAVGAAFLSNCICFLGQGANKEPKSAIDVLGNHLPPSIILLFLFSPVPTSSNPLDIFNILVQFGYLFLLTYWGCLVLLTVMVIFILTCYVLFIALHTMVTCLDLFQIIYMRHYIPRSCTSSPQCLSIHWGVRPLSLFYLFPYLLAVVPHYSTLGTTTEYISVYPFTEVTSLFYSSSLPVPAFLQVIGPDDISEMSLTNNLQALNLPKLCSDGSNWSTYQEHVLNFAMSKGLKRHLMGTARKPVILME